MIVSGREKIEDQIFDTDLNEAQYHNKLLVRVGSKNKKFTKTNFSHTYFDNCYFRDVVFDACNFTGCKFSNCNFQGSSFTGSNFNYTTFDKTYIEAEILDTNCPSYNNLKLKFARALRMNYQGIGDAASVNKAIRIELSATKEHLYEAWKSNSGYYRAKYRGWKRLSMFLQWLYFKIQDFIWGNGESPLNLVRSGLIIWLACAIFDTIIFRDFNSLSDYWSSIKNTPSVIMGIEHPQEYSSGYITVLTIIRFIGFALLTSILIKRYNKR